MRTKKALWLAAIVIVAAVLVFIVSSRINLTTDVIVGGADSVFVNSDTIIKAPEATAADEDETDEHEDLSFPDVSIEDWNFILINAENPTKDNAPSLVAIGDGRVKFDVRAIDQLDKLLKAAKKKGFEPYISCGYMSYAAQQQAFNEKASEIAAESKISYEEAAKRAEKLIAAPGTSDHQTALALDIFDKQYDGMDYSQMNKEFFAWLDSHCAKYGFIKRYPTEKADITGWDEPWHYRFVGTVAAKFITENGLSFEEFCAHYSSD